MNKDPKVLPVPKKNSWAQVASRVIMGEECNATYVEKLVAQDNIKPSHILEPKENRKPEEVADIEKIASTVGIKNVNWSEVRNHQSGHDKK